MLTFKQEAIDLLGFEPDHIDLVYARGGVPKALYIFFSGSCVKALLDSEFFDTAIGTAATRGAAQWAARQPGRQATISRRGEILELEEA